jgi:hypothetical protein
MITSIFSKSKPTNLIIGVLIIALASVFAFFKIRDYGLHYTAITKLIGGFVLSCFAMLLLNFIISKNSLSKTNTLEVPLYSCFLLLIPESTAYFDVVVANVLLLLGVRRIISLRSQKQIKHKLFDAALCIALASLCYTWAVLYFLVVFLAVSLHTENKIRHWLIPIVGCMTVYIIAYCVCFVIDYELFEYMFNQYQIHLDFGHYNTSRFKISITVILLLGFWASWFYFSSITQRKKSVRPAYYITIALAVIALFINGLTLQKNGAALLFLFAPLAIILANYIEELKKGWLKESILGVCLVLPFVLLFFV